MRSMLVISSITYDRSYKRIRLKIIRSVDCCEGKAAREDLLIQQVSADLV